jgi:RimJ/RimL family protein N-acetyltransferase
MNGPSNQRELGGRGLPVETERLRLRRFCEEDVDDIVAYSTGADFWLARNLSWRPDRESVKAYYETNPAWLELVIELREEERVVGSVGIGVTDPEQGQAIVGWLLGCGFQGRGIATEAGRAILTFGFRTMGLHRISAGTGMRNTRSWRLMERLGMRREGHFRKSHRVQGEWDDEFVYAVLADEWHGALREGA